MYQHTIAAQLSLNLHSSTFLLLQILQQLIRVQRGNGNSDSIRISQAARLMGESLKTSAATRKDITTQKGQQAFQRRGHLPSNNAERRAAQNSAVAATRKAIMTQKGQQAFQRRGSRRKAQWAVGYEVATQHHELNTTFAPLGRTLHWAAQ